MTYYYPTSTRIESFTTIRRERLLPFAGRVLARVGDRVDPGDVVAVAELPGPLRALNVAQALRVEPQELPKVLLKGEGDPVAKGEVIAAKRLPLSFSRLTCASPVAGQIVRAKDGWVLIRQVGGTFELQAHLKGSVANVVPRYGVVVETTGALIQGAWGVGGQTSGILRVLVNSPSARVPSEAIDEEAASSIIVAGASMDEASLRRAAEVGARGAVMGSLESRLVGVVKSLGLSVMITEGMGDIPMSSKAFEILSSLDRREAMMDCSLGSPWEDRRPELVIPAYKPDEPVSQASNQAKALGIGDRVRALRAPYIGRLGKVADLPDRPLVMESGERVWGARVQFEDGILALVPFANLERI